MIVALKTGSAGRDADRRVRRRRRGRADRLDRRDGCSTASPVESTRVDPGLLALTTDDGLTLTVEPHAGRGAPVRACRRPRHDHRDDARGRERALRRGPDPDRRAGDAHTAGLATAGALPRGSAAERQRLLAEDRGDHAPRAPSPGRGRRPRSAPTLSASTRSTSCIVFHCLKRSGRSTPIASPTSSRKFTTRNGYVVSCAHSSRWHAW